MPNLPKMAGKFTRSQERTRAGRVLSFYDRLRSYGVGIEPRDRFYARLVGVPVTKAELQARFSMRKGEYDALQPDERKEA